jgi:hypothetical protein
MKKLVFALTISVSFLFTACEKCYECELNSNPNDVVEFCGSAEEADTYEAADYTCSAK